MSRTKLLNPIKTFWYELSNKDFLLCFALVGCAIGTLVAAFQLQNKIVFAAGVLLGLFYLNAEYQSKKKLSFTLFGFLFVGAVLGLAIGLIFIDYKFTQNIVGLWVWLSIFAGIPFFLLRTIHKRVAGEHFGPNQE